MKDPGLTMTVLIICHAKYQGFEKDAIPLLQKELTTLNK
jgi:hypothetical protein